MSISGFETRIPNAIGVKVSGNGLSVKLSDGRMLSIPVDRYPRLAYATMQERANWRIIGKGHGIHWEDIDEDISVEGLLAGRRSGESKSSLTKWLRAKSKPQFRPWKGKDYSKTNDCGLPANLLVLGESHYGSPQHWNCWDGQPTVGVVRDYCKEGGYPFFTKTMRTVLGRHTPTDTGQRKRFFESIAFYNYVQSSVGNKHYIPPTKAMWIKAGPPFCTTLESLRPTHILACGWRLWNNMPADGGWTPPSGKLIGWFNPVDFPQQGWALKSILGYYRHSKGWSVVLAIPHPSRISYVWHRVVKRFLEYSI